MGNTPEGIAMTASGGVILLGNGLIHFCQYNCLGAALIATGSAIGLVGITNPSHVAKTAIGILAAGTDFIQAYHERSTSLANANQSL